MPQKDPEKGIEELLEKLEQQDEADKGRINDLEKKINEEREERLRLEKLLEKSEQSKAVKQPVDSAVTSDITFLFSFGDRGKKKLRLKQPGRIHIYDDLVYISDYDTSNVYIFSEDGWPLGIFENPTLRKRFKCPKGITSLNDKIYVVDNGANCVRIFTHAGSYLGEFGELGSDNGGFFIPQAITSFDNKLYVTDHRIQVFDEQGKCISEFGNKEGRQVTITSPFFSDIKVYDRKIYASRHKDKCVKVFDLSGRFLRDIDYNWNKGCKFDSPDGIAFRNNKIYVADSGNHKIHIIDMARNKVSEFSRYSSENGEEELSFSQGICIKGRRMYVTEVFNSIVKVFEIND